MSAQVTLTEAEREALLSVSTDLDAIAAVERIVAARMAQALRDMRLTKALNPPISEAEWHQEWLASRNDR